MEKYLKIHWSIRIILGVIVSMLILLIISNIYGLIFYNLIQESLIAIPESIVRTITIPMIIGSLILQLIILIVVYKVFDYKRWAILLIFIFIGLPLLISGFGLICYTLFILYTEGLDSIKGVEILFLIFILTIAWFFIRLNIELIRLYKNIKNIDIVASKILRITKPKFLNVFFISSIPIIMLGGLMILLYNPVVPLDLPDGYFKMDGFDLDNPTYTDQTICKNFESGIGTIPEFNRIVTKEDTNSGVILAKRAMFSRSDSDIKHLHLGGRGWTKDYYPENSMEEIQKEKPKEYAIIVKQLKEEDQKRSELKAYIQNNPEQWKKSLIILRSQITNTSVMKLQELTKSLPQEVHCSIRDDKNIMAEFSPRLTQYLVTSRLYDAAIRLALLENNRKEAIDLLQSSHDFNTKFFNSNTNLAGGIVGIVPVRDEFYNVENLIKGSDAEEKKRIQEIYEIPYNIKRSELNSWKGDYYFFDHTLTGRGGSIKELSIPYIFNGEDTLNRGIILLYAGAIAEIQNDTNLLQSIKESKKLNNSNFLTYVERGFIGEGISSWKGDGPIFGRFYNPIGKVAMESLLPSYSYHNSYKDFSLHQDYIRHNLLGIKDGD